MHASITIRPKRILGNPHGILEHGIYEIKNTVGLYLYSILALNSIIIGVGRLDMNNERQLFQSKVSLKENFSRKMSTSSYPRWTMVSLYD